MKRTLLIFLVILYVGNSTGFAMHFHYCMDKLVETNFVYSDLDLKDCDMHKDNDKKKDDCCKDEVKSTKGSSDQLSAESSLKLMQSWSISLPLAFYEIPTFLNLATDASEYPVSNAPPNGQQVPAYIRNCVFRI